MTMSKMLVMETEAAALLEEKLEDVLPLDFGIRRPEGTERFHLDWAPADSSDCDRLTVVDHDGVLYRLEVDVHLTPLPSE